MMSSEGRMVQLKKKTKKHLAALAPPQATNNKGFMVSKVRLKLKPQWVLGQTEHSQVIQFH